MLNQALIALVNSVLGTGKSTSRGNQSHHCPFCNHAKPKLEINFDEGSSHYEKWHCWACDKKGKKIQQLFKAVKATCNRMQRCSAYCFTSRKTFSLSRKFRRTGFECSR